MDLWQRLWQDDSNSCDNTAAERTWIGGSVRDSNGSEKMESTVGAKTWLTGSGGSGSREAEETLRQKRRRRSKLGLAETEGLRRGDSDTEVTASEAE